MRKIHIENQVYEYKVYRSGVKFRSPRSFFVSFSDMLGMTPSDIERGQWKKTFSVTPSQIKEYLIKNP